LIIVLIFTASGFTSDTLGDYVGPFEYKGYLVFEYPEGDNPINNILFTVDSTLAGNLIIVDIPSPWSHSYGDGTLTLTGGSLSPGGSVRVTVSLNKYFESGEYPINSVGTTTAGEVSQASGPLLVGDLVLLNFLRMASAYRFPLAALVAGLAILELFLNRRTRLAGPATVISTKPLNCQELIDKCKKARAAAEAAKAEAQSAKQKADSANLDHEKANKAVQETQKKMDDALKKPSDESEAWVEMDGRRITSMDLRLRSEASRALWDQYRRGDIDAKSLEKAWEELGEHSALEELRKKSWEARKEASEKALEKAKEQAKETEERAKEANAEAASAEKKAAEAKAYADKVCKEADECVKAQAAASKTSTGEGPPSGGTVVAPGGASVVDDADSTETKPKRICEEGERELRPAGRPDTIRVVVDFSLFIETKEETRDEEAARELAINLANLAQDIGLAGSLLSARSSGKSIAGGIGGLRQGKYVTGAGGLISGTATTILTGTGATVGSGQMQISIPTSLPEVVTEVLKGVANLGSIVSKKAAKWIRMNNTYGARVRYFYQTLTATPYELWECKGNKLVCIEKVYEITISELQRGGRSIGQRAEFKLESDIQLTKFNGHISTLMGLVRGQLESGIKTRHKFEQEHQRGPCGS
jgi:hypothetical protein